MQGSGTCAEQSRRAGSGCHDNELQPTPPPLFFFETDVTSPPTDTPLQSLNIPLKSALYPIHKAARKTIRQIGAFCFLFSKSPPPPHPPAANAAASPNTALQMRDLNMERASNDKRQAALRTRTTRYSVHTGRGGVSPQHSAATTAPDRPYKSANLLPGNPRPLKGQFITHPSHDHV